MKKIFILFCMMFIATLVFAQALTEGFEVWPPTGWTLESATEQHWVQNDGTSHGPGTAYEGTYAAMFDNYVYPTGVTASMTTPAFDVSAVPNAQVSFFWWNIDGTYNPATLEILSSTDGTNFTSIEVIETIQSAGWVLYASPLAADVTHIQLLATSDYGLYNTYVDEFVIGEGFVYGTIAGTVTLAGGTGNVEEVVVTAGPESTSPAADGTYSMEIATGTYELTAALEFYETTTVADVVVTEGNTTTVDVTVTALEVPGNDTCETAEVIGEVVDYAWNTTMATTSGVGEHSINQDIWYSYTPVSDGTITVDLCGSGFDTKLAIWDACGGTELDYNDDATYCDTRALQSAILDLPVVSGEDYLIQLGGFSTNAGEGDLTIAFTLVVSDPPVAFFSEYIEGSSNNKALEIWNNNGATINLDEFRINQASNGGGWEFQHSFPAGATIEDQDVWVIISDQTDPALFDPANADEVLSYPSVVHHNGNDARGLEWTPDGGTTWILIDVIGNPDEDIYWDVAGVLEGTHEYTLVRKDAIMTGNTDWALSAGTNADDSEWVVYPLDTFDYLGEHPSSPVTLDPPQNLMVTDEGYATWEAPGGSGEESFADGFESGDLSAWDEFIQGPGTIGDIGFPYWYSTDTPDGAAPEGLYAAQCDWGYSIDTWIISPAVEAGANTAVSFQWYGSYYWSVDPEDNCDLFVKVSTDGGTSWDMIWTYGDIGVWENFTWYETTLPLSDYSGQTIQVAFNLVGNDNSVNDIDDIYVGEEILARTGTYQISEPIAAAIDAKEANGTAITRISRDLLGYNVYRDGVFDGYTTDLFYQFSGLVNGTSYLAEVTAVYDEGESDPIEYTFTYSGSEAGNVIVTATKLGNNYPNPFNPITNIAYSIKETGNVTIEVYNMRGQLVKTLVDEVKETGDHTVIWNGTDNSNKTVSSGVYFYKMLSESNIGRYTSTKKMILMK